MHDELDCGNETTLNYFWNKQEVDGCAFNVTNKANLFLMVMIIFYGTARAFLKALIAMLR